MIEPYLPLEFLLNHRGLLIPRLDQFTNLFCVQVKKCLHTAAAGRNLSGFSRVGVPNCLELYMFQTKKIELINRGELNK